MGRPEVHFSWQTLDAVLQFGASKTDCAEFLDCSEDTIERRIKTKFNMTFTEYRLRKMGKTRVGIMKKQIDMALAGDRTMLIWVGKQICGQSDKFSEPDEVVNNTVQLKYSIPGNKYVNGGKPDVEVEKKEDESLPAVVDQPLEDVEEFEHTNNDDEFLGD